MDDDDARAMEDVEAEVLIDIEAEVTGEDLTGDEEEEDVETTEDRDFLQPLPETQVPTGYAQTQVYRQGLFTQPAVSNGSLNFRERPVRNHGRNWQESNRRRHDISSSPTRLSSPQAYRYDGFVVPDSEGEI